MTENKEFKKHKMLVEFIAQKETENWGIWFLKSAWFMKQISDVAKKNNFDCYIKWYPKSKLDYIPTNKTIEIKTVEDIAKLSEQQFEFFIDDLREWCKISRELKVLNDLWLEVSTKEKWMTWLDTWLNEKKVNIEINSTNKI